MDEEIYNGVRMNSKIEVNDYANSNRVFMNENQHLVNEIRNLQIFETDNLNRCGYLCLCKEIKRSDNCSYGLFASKGSVNKATISKELIIEFYITTILLHH